MTEVLLDAGGRRRRCRDFTPGARRRTSDTATQRIRTVEEIVAVMRAAGDARHGWRLRGLIVVLWRAGQRIHEALALNESDLDPRRGALLVRRGKGGRREVGMDDWAWEHLQPRTAMVRATARGRARPTRTSSGSSRARGRRSCPSTALRELLADACARAARADRPAGNRQGA